MNDVEEQILSYPHLSDEKKREVEAYVEDHPEWAGLLRDVRSLESLTRDTGVDALGRAADEPLLAAYVTAQYLETEVHSSALAAAFEDLERRMDEDPALRERVEAARRRLRNAEAAIDPVAQFEELTGHSLAPEASPTEGPEEAPAERTSGADRRAAERAPVASSESVVDRLLELPLAVRGAGAAIAVLLGAYVVLFAASTASQSTLDRLAVVDVSDQMVESYYSANTRSAAAPSDTMRVDDLYLGALSTLRGARTSTFGLFPSYDAEALERAETQLKQVLDQTETDSFLALQAKFYLGKTYLAQGRVDAARALFETVVERGGHRASEARSILEALREERPEDAPADR